MVEKTDSFTATWPSETEMVMTRVFDAPRSVVFDAWTKCEHLTKWFGPRDWSLPQCEVDLRVGGSYRFLMLKDDGTEMGMGGVYTEVSPPERLLSTERYDDWPDYEAQNTLVLEERDGKTTVTVAAVFNSLEMAQAWSGSAEGASESFDRLDELLKTLA